MHKINATARAILIRVLLEGHASRQEIADETGLHVVTVSDEIRAYRKQEVVWRSGWGEDVVGHKSIELFSLGLGKKDVPRPTQALRQARAARYRQRQRDAKQLNLISGCNSPAV